MVVEAVRCRCSALDPVLLREVVVEAVNRVVLEVFQLVLAHRLVVVEAEEVMGRVGLAPCVVASLEELRVHPSWLKKRRAELQEKETSAVRRTGPRERRRKGHKPA